MPLKLAKMDRDQMVMPVVRWDGLTKTTSDWDGLKRDPDLWIQYGDTLIHLYNEGEYAAGPSFRIPFSEVEARGYGRAILQRGTEYLDYEWSEHYGEYVIRNIYIELPNIVDERQCFDWYITTRNFFAFCLRKPLLSRTTLGDALISLHKRIVLWTPHLIQTDLRQYLEEVGYRNFAHSPDHALGILRYAEYFELEDLWASAFAHCVGMADVLSVCPEYMKLSTYSKCAIEECAKRLSTQMDYACNALANFLEEDMSPTHLGLTGYDRGQLEDFRHFLSSFFAKKFGLWPAPSFYLFPKFLLLSAYSDFEKLYGFMVDPDSSDSLIDNGPASGGVCVLQNLLAFDQRHGFIPLDHPLPLFPKPHSGQLKRRISLNRQSLSRSGRSNSFTLSVSAYSELSHNTERAVRSATMVQAYRQFEEELMKPGNDYAAFCDGRKVRWILVYEVIQILKSLIHQYPIGDISSDASYLVYWDNSTTFPWKDEFVIQGLNSLSERSRPGTASFGSDYTQAELRPVSRHLQDSSVLPDCETDNYLENIEVKKQSWFQTLLLRDPSTNAVRELQRGLDSEEVHKTTPVRKERRKSLDFAQLSRIPNVIKRVQSLSKSSRRRTVQLTPMETENIPKEDFPDRPSTMSNLLGGTINGEVYVTHPTVILDNCGRYIKIRTDLMGVSY